MSRLISLASGKGGVGKTFLAVTLAHALALRGRRVLLFDGDLGLANVDVQLGINADRDLGSSIRHSRALADLVHRHEATGVDILPGESGSGRLAQVPASTLSKLATELRGLARAYDVVLLDLPSGLQTAATTLTAQSDAALIVSTGEPTALTDNYAFIKVACRRLPRLEILVNAAEDHAEATLTYQTLRRACRKFLDLEPALFGSVRRDPKVAEAIRRQTSLLTHAPASDAAADLGRIAGRLLD